MSFLIFGATELETVNGEGEQEENNHQLFIGHDIELAHPLMGVLHTLPSTFILPQAC